MSGSRSRSKGRRGETAAKHLLMERDYTILADLAAGIASCDLLASDPNGGLWSCEVKNRESIPVKEAWEQACKNAQKGTKAMLLAKIHGTSSWLVMRSGQRPTCWHEQVKR